MGAFSLIVVINLLNRPGMDSPLPTVKLCYGLKRGLNNLDVDNDHPMNDSFASPGPNFDSKVSVDAKMTSLVSFINGELTSWGLKCLKTEDNATSHSDVTKLSLALVCVEA